MRAYLRRFKLKHTGDTIVEVMVCLMALSLVMASVYAIGSRSSRSGIEAKQRTEALSLAQSQIDLLINAKNTDPNFATNYENNGQAFCIQNNGSKDTSANSNTDKLCHAYSGTGYNIGITYSPRPSQAGVFVVTAQWPSADSPGGVANMNLYYKLPGIYQKALVVATTSSVNGTSITMNGTVTPNGNPVTDCYFQYSPNASYSSFGQVSCSSLPSGNAGTDVSATISAVGLQPNTMYFFRLCASNLVGTACSDNNGNFTTPAAPTATTTQITSADYNSSSATLRGYVNGNGNPITDCHFEYGFNINYGQTTPCQGATPGNVSATISTAVGNSYHYRVVASNAVGTARGADASFTIPYPPSLDNFYAQPVNIVYGASSTLYWSSTHTTACYSPNMPGGPWFNPSGSQSTGYLTTTTTYSLMCYSPEGTPTGYSYATVYVGRAPSVDSFSATPFIYGGTTTISWSSSNASYCYSPNIPGGPWLATSGSKTSGALYQNTQYTILCGNGSVNTPYSSTTAIMTTGAPTASISATPSSVVYGGSSTITWSSTNAAGCYSTSIPGGPWLGTSGSVSTGSLTSSGTYTYNVACYNSASAWSTTVSATVTVGSAPSVTYFYASPNSIIYGNSSTLYWNSTNTSGCLINNVAWVGTSGSYNVSPTSTTTYQLACYNSASSWTGWASATVTVSTPAPTVSFYADSTSVNYGDTTNLHWSSTNATSCTASGAWSGQATTSGTANTGVLHGTVTYYIYCSGPGGNSPTYSVTVYVGPDGINGYYYAGANFNSYRSYHLDGPIYHCSSNNGYNCEDGWLNTLSNYTGVSPASCVSVRWQGEVLADNTGSYTFTTVSDDGINVWISGYNVISNWSQHSATTNSNGAYLGAGWHSFQVDYQNNNGNGCYSDPYSAVARVYWSGPGFGQTVIPQDHMRPVYP